MKTAFISLIQRISATGIIGKRNRTEQMDLAITTKDERKKKALMESL